MKFQTLPREKLSLNPKDYHYFGRYKCPLLYYSLLQNWGDSRDTSSTLPSIQGQIVVLDGHWSCSQSEWDLISERTIKAIKQKDLKYFKDYFFAALTASNSLSSFLKNEKKGTVEEQLETLFEEVHFLEYPWFYILPLCETIEVWLKKKVDSETLSLFFTPEKPTLLAEYQKSLLDLKINPQKIDSLVKKFAWVGMMHFWGEPNNREKILENSKSISQFVTQIPAFDKIPSDLKWILPITQKATYYRQHFAELCAIASYQLYEIFKKFSIDPDVALWMTPEELLEYLSKKSEISPDVIKNRKLGYGLFNSILTGKDLQIMFDKFVEKVPEKIVIQGTVACKGLAKGKVKIILSPHDMKKMNEGDILVAHETTPDLMNALYKAAAIIADIGGLTSHAAIVSRELGIPCVIGTKIATQLLRDGDMVGVDANIGVVRILK